MIDTRMWVRQSHLSAGDWWRNLPGARLLPMPLRGWLYRLLGIPVNTWRIRGGCFFDSRNVTIGEETFVNYGCYFNARHGSITIEPTCNLGQQVAVITTTHDIDYPRRAGNSHGKPVRIGAGSWVGARATILPGVTIGERCIVAAGAVVTADCAPDGLYAGVPARRIRNLSPLAAEAPR